MRTFVKIQDRNKPFGGTDWNWLESFVRDGGDASSDRLKRWMNQRSGPLYHDVRVFLRTFRHDVLHRIRLDDIEEVVGLSGSKATTHALQGLTEANRYFLDISDFCPPFAIEYLLHDCMEKRGRVPKWTDVKRYMLLEQRGRLIEPFLAKYGLVSGSPETQLGSPYFATLQWRIALAYYSFLREVHLLTVLRRVYGLDVRYHVLADVEFKADLVAGDTLVALYLPNKKYRDDRSGRKVSVSKANPGRKTCEVKIVTHGGYCAPWVADQPSIDRLVAVLEENDCPRLFPKDAKAA